MGAEGDGFDSPPAVQERPASFFGSARARLVAVAACAPATAYLVFVWHYAVNAPLSDDWSRTRIVSEALHGRLTLHDLWAQYSEARLLVPNLFFSAFGFIDHLNLKHVVLFSALVFVASYFLLLIMFRAYLERPLTFLPVIGLGIVWFNLADMENALWAFQLAWYLAVFFFFVMIYFLFLWPRSRKLAVGLAIVAAISGSFSMLFGFVLWPVGVVCLLWDWSPERKRYGELAIWLSSGALTVLLYLQGYRHGAGCAAARSDCSLTSAVSHPRDFARFFLTLVGNVVPVNAYGHLWYKQIYGAVLCIAAAFVIVRSLRARSHDPRIPLPMLVILFALLFDLTIALGRTTEGLAGALQFRYLMPNILLLVGIVAYALAHLPHPRALNDRNRRYRIKMTTACVGLGILILAQGIFSTPFGVRRARVFRELHVQDGRTAVNLDRIPLRQQGCYARDYVWNHLYRPSLALSRLHHYRSSALRDHLIVFAPGTYRKFRAQGPPDPPRQCLRRFGAN